MQHARSLLNQVQHIGPLSVDHYGQIMGLGVRLTGVERMLLEMLIRRSPRSFTFDDAVALGYGEHWLRVFVCRVRAKLAADPACQRVTIVNHKGDGYALEVEQ